MARRRCRFKIRRFLHGWRWRDVMYLVCTIDHAHEDFAEYVVTPEMGGLPQFHGHAVLAFDDHHLAAWREGRGA